MGQNAFQVGSVVAVVAALAFASVRMQFISEATMVGGRVASVRHEPGCGRDNVATITVGNAQIEKSFGRKGRQYKVGDRVDILVDPTDASDMLIESDAKGAAIMAVVVSMACAFAAFQHANQR